MTEPRNEIVDDQITDLEVEDATDPSSRRTPWDPRKIRVSTKPWSLRQVIDDINDGTIDLAPDFQRPSVWRADKRSRLIESVLLGIPLPAFYFSADRDGGMQVVDGVQRLSAITDFAKGELRLQNLEYLADLDGKLLDGLEPGFRRRFHQTQIFVNVIEPETPTEVKFNIFKRINTGGEPLTTQEIRHALSSGRSRAMLKRMVTSEAFRKATDHAFDDDVRMNARELALRFIAIRLDTDLVKYEKTESVDDYLIACTKRLDDPADVTDEQIALLERAFVQAMESAYQLFGPHAFRKWPAGASGRKFPLNRALFESWSVALAERPYSELQARKEAIVTALRETMATSKEYLSSITAATADLARVRLRLGIARQILKEAS